MMGCVSMAEDEQMSVGRSGMLCKETRWVNEGGGGTLGQGLVYVMNTDAAEFRCRFLHAVLS